MEEEKGRCKGLCEEEMLRNSVEEAEEVGNGEAQKKRKGSWGEEYKTGWTWHVRGRCWEPRKQMMMAGVRE